MAGQSPSLSGTDKSTGQDAPLVPAHNRDVSLKSCKMALTELVEALRSSGGPKFEAPNLRIATNIFIELTQFETGLEDLAALIGDEPHFSRDGLAGFRAILKGEVAQEVRKALKDFIVQEANKPENSALSGNIKALLEAALAAGSRNSELKQTEPEMVQDLYNISIDKREEIKLHTILAEVFRLDMGRPKEDRRWIRESIDFDIAGSPQWALKVDFNGLHQALKDHLPSNIIVNENLCLVETKTLTSEDGTKIQITKETSLSKIIDTEFFKELVNSNVADSRRPIDPALIDRFLKALEPKGVGNESVVEKNTADRPAEQDPQQVDKKEKATVPSPQTPPSFFRELKKLAKTFGKGLVAAAIVVGAVAASPTLALAGAGVGISMKGAGAIFAVGLAALMAMRRFGMEDVKSFFKATADIFVKEEGVPILQKTLILGGALCLFSSLSVGASFGVAALLVTAFYYLDSGGTKRTSDAIYGLARRDAKQWLDKYDKLILDGKHSDDITLHDLGVYKTRASIHTRLSFKKNAPVEHVGLKVGAFVTLVGGVILNFSNPLLLFANTSTLAASWMAIAVLMEGLGRLAESKGLRSKLPPSVWRALKHINRVMQKLQSSLTYDDEYYKSVMHYINEKKKTAANQDAERAGSAIILKLLSNEKGYKNHLPRQQ